MHLGDWSRRRFLYAAAMMPAVCLARPLAGQQSGPAAATSDLELDVASIAGAPPLRVLGKRIFNCYSYLASIAMQGGEGLTAEEKKFAPAAAELRRALDPFNLGLHRYFESGMVEAGSEPELLEGLERQARLFSTGVSAAIMQALDSYEKEIWPRHRALIQESLRLLEKHFGSERERLIATQTARLGYRKFPAQFTVSLVVARIAQESSSHPILLSLTSVHDSDLVERLIEEMTHVLSVENADEPGTADALLETLLTGKGLAWDARRRVIKLLQAWTAGDLVRERADAAHVPSVIRRHALESVSRTYRLKLSEELLRTIWGKYVEGKLELDAALRQFADALL